MTAETVTICPFDFRQADEAARRAYNDYFNAIRAELDPGDPPRSLRAAMAFWENLPSFVDLPVWHALTADGQIVGSSQLRVERVADNPHIASFTVDVAPEWRQRSLARRLLAPVALSAGDAGRSLLLSRSSERIPAGAALLQRAGAQPTQTLDVNQLDLAEVDGERMAAWIARAPQAFALSFRQAPFPQEELEEITAYLSMTRNESPHGALELEEIVITPEEVRAYERAALNSGRQIWALFARHRATGALAGGTEIMLDPEQPHLVFQLDTGVFPQFRRHGLGRWLKAAMLERLRAGWPAARFVRTGNATSNASMLHINHEIGFRLYQRDTLWQIPTGRLLAYAQGSEPQQLRQQAGAGAVGQEPSGL